MAERDGASPPTPGPSAPPPDGVPPGAAALRERFPASCAAARAARHMVGAACREWGLRELRADAETVVGELATNAVRHARTPFELAVSRVGDGVRIEVRDGSPRPARPKAPDPLGTGGRGLLLVAALSTRWSSERLDPGKRVTAELHRPDPHSGAPDRRT